MRWMYIRTPASCGTKYTQYELAHTLATFLLARLRPAHGAQQEDFAEIPSGTKLRLFEDRCSRGLPGPRRSDPLRSGCKHADGCGVRCPYSSSLAAAQVLCGAGGSDESSMDRKSWTMSAAAMPVISAACARQHRSKGEGEGGGDALTVVVRRRDFDDVRAAVKRKAVSGSPAVREARRDAHKVQAGEAPNNPLHLACRPPTGFRGSCGRRQPGVCRRGRGARGKVSVNSSRTARGQTCR